MSCSLPKKQGPGVRQRKAVDRAQGRVTSTQQLHQQQGLDLPISGLGVGAMTMSALTGSQA